jgi:hypothetical protein
VLRFGIESAMAKQSAQHSKATKKTPNRRSKPKNKADKKPDGTCFVLMPFSDPFDMYYRAIFEPAVKSVNLKPLRGDSLFRPSPIMADVWSMIRDAKVILAELTTKNANVFYELGLAHAIGKPVVLVAESMDDVPFDLQQLRVLLYNKNDPAWGEILQDAIKRSIEETLAEPVEAVPSMYRKKVKSQAPEDSEINVRLDKLERMVRSLTFHNFNFGRTQSTQDLKSEYYEKIRQIANVYNQSSHKTSCWADLENKIRQQLLWDDACLSDHKPIRDQLGLSDKEKPGEDSAKTPAE